MYEIGIYLMCICIYHTILFPLNKNTLVLYLKQPHENALGYKNKYMFGDSTA